MSLFPNVSKALEISNICYDVQQRCVVTGRLLRLTYNNLNNLVKLTARKLITVPGVKDDNFIK